MSFTTTPTRVDKLEPGDEYLVRTDGRHETRRVLGVLNTGPAGALLEVVSPIGSVFRSHMSGEVEVIVEITP